MKTNIKSSITLPREELDVVLDLKRELGVSSNVEVVRRALKLLKDSTEREALVRAYHEAVDACRESTEAELAELDHLAGEGLDEW